MRGTMSRSSHRKPHDGPHSTSRSTVRRGRTTSRSSASISVVNRPAPAGLPSPPRIVLRSRTTRILGATVRPISDTPTPCPATHLLVPSLDDVANPALAAPQLVRPLNRSRSDENRFDRSRCETASFVRRSNLFATFCERARAARDGARLSRDIARAGRVVRRDRDVRVGPDGRINATDRYEQEYGFTRFRAELPEPNRSRGPRASLRGRRRARRAACAASRALYAGDRDREICSVRLMSAEIALDARRHRRGRRLELGAHAHDVLQEARAIERFDFDVDGVRRSIGRRPGRLQECVRGSRSCTRRSGNRRDARRRPCRS